MPWNTAGDGFPFEHDHIDSVFSEFACKREPTRTGADDRHLALVLIHCDGSLMGCWKQPSVSSPSSAEQ
jgi:hypothetical protein